MRSTPFRQMDPGAKVIFVAAVLLAIPIFAIVLGALVWVALVIWLAVGRMLG